MGGISLAGDTNVHGGAPFDTGLTTTVLIQGKGIALSGQTGSSQNDTQYNQNPRAHSQGISSNQTAAAGSATVFAEGKAIHRIKDERKDGATAGPGSSSVLADGGTAGAGSGDNPTNAPAVTGTGGFVQSFKGTPDPNYFALDANGNPFAPKANAVAGVDYAVAEFTPGIYTIVNLHDYTPDKIKIEPVEAGKGIARTYTIDGYTFETARFYTQEEYNPSLYQYGLLSKEERLALISEYGAIYKIDFIIGGGALPGVDTKYYDSGPEFQAFLQSKGLG